MLTPEVVKQGKRADSLLHTTHPKNLQGADKSGKQQTGALLGEGTVPIVLYCAQKSSWCAHMSPGPKVSPTPKGAEANSPPERQIHRDTLMGQYGQRPGLLVFTVGRPITAG